LVSPQIILVALALIAFFATGGIGKAQRAIVTAKQDFQTVKGKITKFRSDLPNSSDNPNDQNMILPKFLPKSEKQIGAVFRG